MGGMIWTAMSVFMKMQISYGVAQGRSCDVDSFADCCSRSQKPESTKLIWSWRGSRVWPVCIGGAVGVRLDRSEHIQIPSSDFT